MTHNPVGWVGQGCGGAYGGGWALPTLAPSPTLLHCFHVQQASCPPPEGLQVMWVASRLRHKTGSRQVILYNKAHARCDQTMIENLPEFLPYIQHFAKTDGIPGLL